MVAQLTYDEMRFAGDVGLRRQIESLEKKRKARFPERYPGQLYVHHIFGAMAELFVCNALGVEWGAHVNLFHKADIVIGNKEIDVRYSPERTDIKVRMDDPDKWIIVGVTGLPREMKIVGWCYAWQAKMICEPTAPAKGQPALFMPWRHKLSALKEELHLSSGRRDGRQSVRSDVR